MSETDPIQACQDALRTLEAAERKAEGLAQYVVNAGAALRDWKDLTFANLRPPISFPIGMRQAINAEGWPTAAEVAQAITDYHTAQNDVQNAWRRVPSEKRVGMSEPPGRR